MFREAGFEGATDDPAVLNVRGRLLKDRALGAAGKERRRLYLEAADAYSRAAAIHGALYPLINAATLSLLAGRRRQAQRLARKILERGRRGDEEPETPYWRTATQAEALLLLGDVAGAKAAFREAITLAPLAYEDHASTLRQFALILDELGEDKTWLDASRPPRSLYFAGHMGLSSRGGAVERDIRAFIKRERIGFGHGALAAGADILIAEALLEKGAELHLVLPAPKKQFREASVVKFGTGWARRFDGILEDAASVRSIAEGGNPLSPLAIRLASEISMGAAVMQASALMSEAVQLLILENGGKLRANGISDSAGKSWREAGRRQYVMRAPRVRPAARGTIKATRDERCILAVMLRIDLSTMAAGGSAELAAQLGQIFLNKTKPLFAPRWTGEEILISFADVSDAAQAALAAAAALGDSTGWRIAGHYAIVEQLDGPVGDGPYLSGGEIPVLREILRSTPPGAAHVSENFAAALHAGPAKGRPRTEYVGELPSGEVDDPLRLYSLRR